MAQVASFNHTHMISLLQQNLQATTFHMMTSGQLNQAAAAFSFDGNYSNLISTSSSSSSTSSQDSTGVTNSPNGCHRKRPAVEADFRIKYKTEMCRNWSENGFCEFEDHCAFAHGPNEIRPKTYLTKFYKTKRCKSFHEYGYCVYGERCQFLHRQKSFDGQKGAAFTLPRTEEKKPRRASFSDAILRPQNYFNSLPTATNGACKRLKIFQAITSESMSS
mmetsp:Transcript_31234/g.35558  ORF Transcript_31234/g.35558 Transcript_31234/m.35558 type:complete len:219 (-) Transcript_31234:470-1126(-)